jgi:serine/threonine-protein kinase
VSPEQALGQDVTGQSDLYSLGVVLYEMLTGEVPFTGESQVAVAMKHVREQIPDVQLKRPEISAALASVVDTATAKRLDERYADDAELIADLEDVLAIETARSGNVTGEVTTVLRTLPSRKRRRLPLRRRQPVVVAVLGLIVVAAVVGALIFLANRTHHGTGTLAQAPPKATPHQVSLCDSCARDYNPDALSGAKNQHPEQVNLAIDGDRNTAWSTESYLGDNLGKPGVGIYVDAKPGVAAGSMIIDTDTPGYAVTVYARSSRPDPNTFDTAAGGWVKVGSAPKVQAKQTIKLSTGDTRYRYYLVWITSLGAHSHVDVNEIALYT